MSAPDAASAEAEEGWNPCRAVLLFLAILLSAFAGSRALGEERNLTSVEGRLSAVSAEMAWRAPPGVTIETREADLDGVDGPQVQAVGGAIRQALAARGIAAVEDGSHVLRFEVSSGPASAVSPPPSRSPLPGDPDDAIPTHHPPGKPYRPLGVAEQITVPLPPDSTSENPADLMISFVLFEPGERPVWRATVAASGEVEDSAALLRGMTRVAMATLGSNEEREFTLNCAPVTSEQGGSCQP